MLRDNGLCVVEAKDPSTIRFVETPLMDYSRQEQAAIALVKKILMDNSNVVSRSEITHFLTTELMKGSPVKSVKGVKETSL